MSISDGKLYADSGLRPHPGISPVILCVLVVKVLSDSASALRQVSAPFTAGQPLFDTLPRCGYALPGCGQNGGECFHHSQSKDRAYRPDASRLQSISSPDCQSGPAAVRHEHKCCKRREIACPDGVTPRCKPLATA